VITRQTGSHGVRIDFRQEIILLAQCVSCFSS